jgi:hypothetical protein
VESKPGPLGILVIGAVGTATTLKVLKCLIRQYSVRFHRRIATDAALGSVAIGWMLLQASSDLHEAWARTLRIQVK